MKGKCILSVLIALLLSVNVLYAQDEEQEREVEGVSEIVLRNRKDISDPVNKQYKDQLKMEAMADALGQADSRITSLQNLKKEWSSSSHGGESVDFDNYTKMVNDALQEYNLVWRRVGSFTFEQTDKKKWRCTVKGIIVKVNTSQKNSLSDKYWANKKLGDKDSTQTDADKSKEQKYKVIDKFFAHIKIEPPAYSGAATYYKKSVINTKQMQIVAYKPVAYIWINKKGDLYSNAKIIKGVKRVSTSNYDAFVLKKYWATKREGFQMSHIWYFNDNQNISDVTKSSNFLKSVSRFVSSKNDIEDYEIRSVSTLSVGYFLEDYIRRYRLSLDFEMNLMRMKRSGATDEKDDLQKYYYSGVIGGAYNFPLMQNFLYLVPEINARAILANGEATYLLREKDVEGDFDFKSSYVGGAYSAVGGLLLRLSFMDIYAKVAKVIYSGYSFVQSSNYIQVGVAFNTVKWPKDRISLDGK